MPLPARVVVVAHPEDDVAELIAACLTSEGCEVVQVRRVVDGLARAVESSCSVVLFLTHLQQFTSVRVPLANVCADHRFGIVLSTGAPSTSRPSHPGLVVLGKPFTFDELLAAVANAWSPTMN
jgi:DNA-binding NtrC family response regulator